MAKTKRVDKQIEVDSLKDQLFRALADYDNLRKRTEREREELETLSTVRFVTRVLPILDMFESVQKHIADSGLAIAINEFKSTLNDEGYEEINPKTGEKFDENVHEAVETVTEKGRQGGEIVSTQLSGWRLANGFIIRPAKVTVARS